MNDYAIGSALADNFDKHGRWTYSEQGKAVVYSSNTLGPVRLGDEYKDQADHIALVAYDEEPHTMDARKQDIARLIEEWRIPAEAISCLFADREFQGLYTASNRRHSCMWYHVPTQHFTEYGPVSKTIHVWQVLDTISTRVRVLVVYPSPMRELLLPMLQSLGGPGLFQTDWTLVHSIVIKNAVRTWEDTRWWNMALHTMTEMTTARDRALETGPVENCNGALLKLLLLNNSLTELKQLTVEFMLQFAAIDPSCDHLAALSSSAVMRNCSNTIEYLLGSYKFLKEALNLSRHTLCTSIEIRNASYVLKNTIELRRIAQQNQIDIAEQKKQSISARKESYNMAKIAKLTMLYLPASFVATFFSMPIFALGDALHFSNLGLIWVYFIFAIAFTILTFVGSWAWDKLSPDSTDAQVDKPNQSDVEGQNPDNDGHVNAPILEPDPYVRPSDGELVERIMGAMRPRHGYTADDDGDDDDDDDDDDE